MKFSFGRAKGSLCFCFGTIDYCCVCKEDAASSRRFTSWLMFANDASQKQASGCPFGNVGNSGDHWKNLSCVACPSCVCGEGT